MEFKEALKILNIEDYGERIFNSNSNGELFHLIQYGAIAEEFKNDSAWFRGWFLKVVRYAEQNWNRPESVFQHIEQILIDTSKPV